jgi:hypothetical protein
LNTLLLLAVLVVDTELFLRLLMLFTGTTSPTHGLAAAAALAAIVLRLDWL